MRFNCNGLEEISYKERKCMVEKTNYKRKILAGGIATFVWVLVCAYYCKKTFEMSNYLGVPMQWGFFGLRVVLLAIPYGMALLWIKMGNKDFGQMMYKRRFWIACGLFFFLVLCKINYSSMAVYENYIQPGTASIFGYPLFGEARAIRSDEWSVMLTRYMSTDYAGYGLQNSIVRGTTTDNLSASGLYLSYSSLARPVDWGYYIFRDSAYGLAWNWNFKLIFGFLSFFELVMILTKGDKKVSLLGAVLIWLSTFSLWWSMVTTLFVGTAAVVLFNYFLKEENRIVRVLYALGMGIFISNFVVELYPAWQVPEAYFFLAIVIWIIASNWEIIKQYKAIDYVIVGLTLLFTASVTLKFLYDYQSYMVAIMNTKYPGGRVELGGYSLPEMYTYLVSSIASFGDVGNPCEIGTFFAVYPLGLVLLVLALWKRKGKDLLLWLLLVPTMVLMAYCYMPLPEKIAKITLLTFSTPSRAQDILAFGCALIFLIVISRADQIQLPWVVSVVIVALCVCPAIEYARSFFGYTKRFYECAFGGIVAILLIACIISEKSKFRTMSYFIMTGGLLFIGLSVNPVMCGTDALRSRPVAKAVEKIVSEDEDGKWISLSSIWTANYLISCGAPTYNSTNYIPNMEFWSIVDPEGKFDECYNRYAHIAIELIEEETYVELVAPDALWLHLSYDDLEKLGVSYLFCQTPEERFEENLIYDEAGVYIYHIGY